jgi:sugar lactone lactonase YvrE
VTTVEAPFPGRCDLGEGPVWLAGPRRLLFVDIDAGVLHRLDPATGDDRTIPVPPPVGFAVPVDGTSELVCGIGGDLALVDDGGPVIGGHAVEVGRPTNRMNDGKADPAGRVWFGSMSLDRTPGSAALYCFDADGVRTATDGLTLSNGLDWDLERGRMYHVDSTSRQVFAYQYDVGTGAVVERRTFATIDAGDGSPDGLTLDVEGCLWVALFGGGVVRRYDPDGAVMGATELPVSCPTSVAFGGDHLSTLFVTTSRHELDAAQRAAEPLAGAILVVDAGVRGRPCNLVGADVAARLRAGADR